MSVDGINTSYWEKTIKNAEEAMARLAECFTFRKDKINEEPISDVSMVYILIAKTFEEGKGKLISIFGVYTDLEEAKKEIVRIKDDIYKRNEERLKQDGSLNLELSMTNARVSYSIGNISESYYIIKCELNNNKEQYTIHYEKERKS